MSVRQPILFVSHGGGPLPLMEDPSHLEMLDTFAEIREGLTHPSAILLISAHWEAPEFTLTASASPGMIYDYYGFPPETYHYQYPAPGAPDLAMQIKGMLQAENLSAHLDFHRGFDHGMFVPMMLLFPEADIPVVQLSLKKGLDAQAHLKLGEALRCLSEQGVLVIGSGYSFHNLSAMMGLKTSAVVERCQSFHSWLDRVITDETLTSVQRVQQLADWQNAPYARFCHPREEHLLPLHVCCTAASAKAASALSFNVLGLPARCYLWPC